MRYPRRYIAYATQAAQQYGVERSLVLGVIWTESKFERRAESAVGAAGLMQLMRSTAEECAAQMGMTFSEALLWDAETNIQIGTYYLSMLMMKFGDEQSALAAYNAGEGNVSKWLAEGLAPDSFPYPETRNYLRRVRRAATVYRMRGYR